MIKEILAVLMILSIAGLASASSVNIVTDPIYESSDIAITWSYTYPQKDMVYIIINEDKNNHINNAWYTYVPNVGSYTILNDDLDGYLEVTHNYDLHINHKYKLNGGTSDSFTVVDEPIVEPPIEPPVEPPIEVPLPPPPKPRPFFGYTFGTSDCNRMAILMGQPPNAHANYTMEVISWDYKYNVTEMISYCERCGANMTSITNGFYTWNP